MNVFDLAIAYVWEYDKDFIDLRRGFEIHSPHIFHK